MRRRVSGAVGLLAGVAALLTACAPPPPRDSGSWAVELAYSDLQVGTCLDASLADSTEPDPVFDANADLFRSVSCRSPHVAEVVAIVDVPAAAEWEDYGTAGGPDDREAAAWLFATCDAVELVLLAGLQDAGDATAVAVSSNETAIGEPVLGYCIAHAPDRGPFPDLDLESLLEHAANVEFASGPQLERLDGGLPRVGTLPVDWHDVPEGACVATFSGPDDSHYWLTECTLPHEAQLMLWVPMPEDWLGEYAGDAAARAVVAAVCSPEGPIPSSLAEPAPLVFVAGEVAASYVVQDTLLAPCWARAADGAPLAVDLTAAG